MHGELKDWNNGWHGLSLGVTGDELDHLIRMLEQLRKDPDQHFHVSSDYSGSGGLGDIEFYVAPEDATHNMRISGWALAPGSNPSSAGA
nr:putative integron gene cassette protein [uncultured bacterium]